MRLREGAAPSFKGDPETFGRYLAGQRVWDERIGSAVSQAANWRRAFFAMSLLALLLTGGLIWLSLQPRLAPYIVEVGPGGRVLTVAALSRTAAPTDPQIALTLHQFVTRLRAVPMDVVLMRRNWLEAYQTVTDTGMATLTALAEKEQPFTRAGRDRIDVEIQETLKQTDKTYQVSWLETVYPAGSLTGKPRRMSGSFQIRFAVTDDPERLRVNPFGVYIDSFTITESKPLP